MRDALSEALAFSVPTARRPVTVCRVVAFKGSETALWALPTGVAVALSKKTHHSGHAYREARRLMFLHKGTVCALCGHHGAGEADYIVPVARAPHQPVHWTMMQPTHGVNALCPVCGKACNQLKGTNATLPTLNTSRDW